MRNRLQIAFLLLLLSTVVFADDLIELKTGDRLRGTIVAETKEQYLLSRPGEEPLWISKSDVKNAIYDAPGTPEEKKKMRQEAKEAAKGMKFERALQILDRLLKWNPEDKGLKRERDRVQKKGDAAKKRKPNPRISGMGKPGQFVMNVALLIYNPINPNNQSQTLYKMRGANNPEALAKELKRQLEEASCKWLKVQIVETILVREFPEHEDGYRYTWDQWDDGKKGSLDKDRAVATSRVSYVKMIKKSGLDKKIDAEEVDEVWYFAPGGIGVYETAMGGKGSFWINGGMDAGGDQLTKRRFVVTWINVTHNLGMGVKVAISLHTHGHRAEAILSRVYGGWNRTTPKTSWERFTMLEKDFPGEGAIGNIHYPVNGLKDYDYNNDRNVLSNCDDWLRYPRMTGKNRKKVNGTTWGGGDTGYCLWWFQHLPRAPGITPNDLRRNGAATSNFPSQNNWWKYIFDLNNKNLWGSVDKYSTDNGRCHYTDKKRKIKRP